MKKDLEESIINGEKKQNIEMQEKVNNVTNSQDATKVLQKFEKIIKNKKSYIMCLTYYQGQIFQKFK